ncbi:HIT family protein [Georgenia sp. TF02-10]|uniref:HIT family protein n=1 Tax=Georgenia sp. TF02-10 TaxID=2917725 RepID=UPI001FA6BCA8|nr:HIT family protein [Georgenia sp. TF02-10]UNX54612.1 HIT family protein [Georgenia sp. TF02-10]
MSGGRPDDGGCLFCRIVAGEEPASVVHAEARMIAFLDAFPVNPGHVLLVPRRHAVGLADLDPADGVALWRVAHRLAPLLRAEPWGEGVNLHLSDGAAAHQEVMHVHLHVIPRRRGDGLRIVQDNPASRPRRAELDEVAGRLRGALGA